MKSLRLLAAVFLIAAGGRTVQACTTDVTTLGIAGNATTDNTVALNNLFRSIAARQMFMSPNTPASAPCRSVYFPQGTYMVSGPITVNASDITIYGDNRLTSIIQQKTANVPIFQWTNETDSGAYGVVLHDLGLNFTNLPSRSSTSQWAVKFQCATTLGYGYALNSFERLAISHAYVGIGTPAHGNLCPVWSTSFQSLLFTYIQHSALSFTSTGGGLPANLIDRVDILNYAEDGKQLESDGPAIQVFGGSGLVCRSINIEDWYNAAYDFEGGKGTLIDQPRFERLHFSNGGGFNGSPVLFFLGNGDFTIRSLVIESFAETSQSGGASILAVGNGSASGNATLDISGASIAAAKAGHGNVYLFKAPNPAYARITERGIMPEAGIAEVPTSGLDQFSRVSSDGLPPTVESLPPAGVVFRGRMFSVLSSGPGVPDATYVCQKTATGAYTWHAM